MACETSLNMYFALILLNVFASCSQKQEIFFDKIAFQEGDLVFRKGIGAKSQAVLLVDSSGIYSHAGIVVLQDSNFRIVHITPGEQEKGEKNDKIKMESANVFWRRDRAVHGAVYRLKENILAKKAAGEALRLLRKGILFDHEYQLNDTTTMYCTEFVWYVYKQADIDVSSGKRSILSVPLYSGMCILPSDIYTNDSFILISNF